jgi:APA family basic amino acid/polyamine antiporter
VLSQFLGISRMLFAMGRRRDLPALLDHVHPRYGVPDRRLVVTGFFLISVALFGTLQVIVAAASFTILLYYTITNLAALRMKREDKLFPSWIALAGLASCLVLATTLEPRVIASGLGLLLAGFVLRWLYHRIARPD